MKCKWRPCELLMVLFFSKVVPNHAKCLAQACVLFYENNVLNFMQYTKKTNYMFHLLMWFNY